MFQIFVNCLEIEPGAAGPRAWPKIQESPSTSNPHEMIYYKEKRKLGQNVKIEIRLLNTKVKSLVHQQIDIISYSLWSFWVG